MNKALLIPAVAILCGLNSPVPAQVTRVASVASDGTAADAAAHLGGISADGRWIVFDSTATTLCEEPVSNFSNVFIHDMKTGLTSLLSRHFGGSAGDGPSRDAVISADGRFVAFYSEALLLPDDLNFRGDVYVWDRVQNQLSRASVNSQGIEGNGDSRYPSISADGRYVVFSSIADNLVLDDRNRHSDIFVRDREAGVTRRVNLGPQGQQGNADSLFPRISGDGRFVSFCSDATNLVQQDHNEVPDAFVAEVATAGVTRISVSSSGEEADFGSCHHSYGAGLSFDGRYVVFESDASNLVPNDPNGGQDIFLRDLATGTIEPISVSSDGAFGDRPSHFPSISEDGRYVLFTSYATNLVEPGIGAAGDAFVKDRLTGAVSYLWLGPSGSSLPCASWAVLSGDARTIGLYADDCVPGDTNGFPDVLVHGPLGEVRGLWHEKTGGSGHRLHWDAEVGQSLAYDLHAGSLAALRSWGYDHGPLGGGASCGVPTNVFDADDAFPADGERYYLVALRNAVGEGTLGTRSDGSRRPPSATPCP